MKNTMIKKELDKIKECPKVGKGDDLARDKTTYFIQQLGNNGIKEVYKECIEPTEKEVSNLGKAMIKKGYSENDIARKMGIDAKEYSEYSDIDKSKKIAVMLLSGKKKEEISFTEAEGRIIADYVNLYPPGIPILVPGERIKKEHIALIKNYLAKDMHVQGISNGNIWVCR